MPKLPITCRPNQTFVDNSATAASLSAAGLNCSVPATSLLVVGGPYVCGAHPSVTYVKVCLVGSNATACPNACTTLKAFSECEADISPSLCTCKLGTGLHDPVPRYIVLAAGIAYPWETKMQLLLSILCLLNPPHRHPCGPCARSQMQHRANPRCEVRRGTICC